MGLQCTLAQNTLQRHGFSNNLQTEWRYTALSLVQYSFVSQGNSGQGFLFEDTCHARHVHGETVRKHAWNLLK